MCHVHKVKGGFVGMNGAKFKTKSGAVGQVSAAHAAEADRKTELRGKTHAPRNESHRKG